MRRATKYAITLAVFGLFLFILLFGLRGSGLQSLFAQSEFALQFDGVDDRVTFGIAPELGAATFTLELWFKRTGAGVTTATGTGGLQTAIPLLTKGMAEGETPANLNMNYFLGIDGPKRVLVADFEDTATGGNHPVEGRTQICDNIWYHAAATYDGTTWRLYLNGELETSLVVGAFTPQFNSIQHAAIGTALGSLGAIPSGQTRGAFKGVIDEPRIWNVARSQLAIQTTMGGPVLAAANLVGRWGLDEGTGTIAVNSAGPPNGTLASTNPATPPVWVAGSGYVTGLVPGNDALRLASPGDYVTFGAATSTLGASRFTVETWFKREGTGTSIGTGTNGLTAVLPLVTKGRGEQEGSNVDFNYFLGINTAITPTNPTPVLAADFEEGATGTSPGLNHPITGSTEILMNTWYHAAVTYDGTTLQLYLNGVPDGAPVVVGQPPRADSIQHAALGTALNSTGVAAGSFAGLLDETRIWNYARSASQMAASANREIPTGTGLLARWSFNDCCGRVTDSTGHLPLGTLFGPGWGWVPRGTPALSTVVNAAPTAAAGADQTITLPASALLNGAVSDDGVDTGAPLTSQWSKTSGPGTVAFADPSAPGSSVTFSTAGTYVLTLTASDGDLSASDAVTIVVNGASSATNTAIQLGGTNAYVTLGAAPTLGASTFTLEAWVRRDGTGVATSSGNGGVTAVPIVTKGMAEVEGSNVDMNYFLGITPGTGRLAADFEDTATGGNHPVNGNAVIAADGSWHHVAATYDGTTWQLYVDGNLDATLSVGAFTPRFDSIQHAAIGTALNSTGAVTTGQTAGRFHGAIDEVRIWNYARSQAQILSGRNREIPTASALLGRFGLNEGAGTSVASSVGVVTGTVVGANFSWVSGAPMPGGLNAAPAVGAGADQTVTLPATGTLTGSMTDDGRSGAVVTTLWSQASGPGVATFGTPTSTTTTVGFTAAGTYVLQLRADDGELSATDTVSVVVDGVGNLAPVVEAGANQTITLPANVVPLSGSASDDGPAGSLTPAWSKVSGPGSVTFGNAAAFATDATFSMQGSYVLRLSVSDGSLSGSDTVTVTVNTNPANKALQFSGTNAFVTLGVAPSLGAAKFTLETWFRRDGTGIATNTGSGGVVAIPLVTKGMAETEGGPVDMNYFLGIRSSDNVLVADFEDTATGLNHPVAGTTAIAADGAWRHAAVTYDGTTWRLYLDGVLQTQLVVGAFTPRSDSIQHAALGTALNSTGGVGSQAQGFFNGALDEARIWNYARSPQQIGRGRLLEVAVPTPGLLGRWGMNEGVGTSVGNSAGAVNGTVVGSAWSWVGGAPFTGVNQAPAAVDDLAAATEDAAATIAVLGNDSDADGDVLTLSAVGTPAHGAAVANANGTITYTPAANFSGADSFSYNVNDGQGGTGSAVVNVTVTGSNDAPVAVDDTATTNEDTPVSIAVLANDSDDGASASLTPVIVTGPIGGSLTIVADGTISYAPAANFNGSDSFTYKASDGEAQSGLATVRVTVQAVNDVPTAGSDSFSVDEDATLQVTDPGVLGNDSDVEGDSLIAMLVTGPAHGGLTFNTDGSFVYTPDPNYNGSDSFTYRANDGTDDSAAATVSLTIGAGNDVPLAAGDSYSTNEDTPLSAAAPGVLANDSDADGQPLQAVLVSGPTQGSLVFNADGSFTYTPASNANGADSFSYKATDGLVDSNTATVAITVNAVDDAPVAANDAFTIGEDTSLNVSAPGVLANDTDADSTGLTAVLLSGVSHGTLTSNADGSFIYTPAADFHGTDTFTYRASDGAGVSNVATVSLTVTPVNDAPVASDDHFSATEETALSVPAPGVLANDSDAEGQALTATLVTSPGHGSLTFNANGSFTYTPAADYTGADSFTYRTSDGSAQSGVATVSIAVNVTNDVPVANADSFSTGEDTPLVVNAPGVIGNDSDPDGNSLTAILVVGPKKGTLLLNIDGSFTFTPAANYNGPDKFTYRVNDGTADSNIATVTLTVTPVVDAPTAVDNSYTKNEDIELSVAAPGILANDLDGDNGGNLTATLVSGVSNGTLVLNLDGSFSYTPALNFNGTDSFTYRAHDGTLPSNAGTVTIIVRGINDAPVAVNETYSLNEDTPLAIAAPGVLANDTDADNEPLTALRVSGPTHGTLTFNADGSFVYTPNANFVGPDTFSYRARDAAGATSLGSVGLVVNAVPDAPIANNQVTTVSEDSRRTVALAGWDADGDPLTYTIVTPPAHGTLAGSLPFLTYEPFPNYVGPDSFTFQVNDGGLNSNVATVSVTVTPVNDAPVAQGAEFSTPAITPFTGQLVATDIDGNPLTYAITTQPTKGTVTLTPGTNTFTYTPGAGKTGPDSFRFRANDGVTNSNIARIDIQIR